MRRLLDGERLVSSVTGGSRPLRLGVLPPSAIPIQLAALGPEGVRLPTDQAWIETLFGHVKGEWPHLEKIRDPGELALELARRRAEYNTVRLHAAVDFVTPDDEHCGRGDAIRQARRDGLAQARQTRLAYRRSRREATA